MATKQLISIHSITEFHRLRSLPPPVHPLISIVDYSKVSMLDGPVIFDYYSISVKRGMGKMFYGQQEYDFDEGVMYFMAPNQILTVQPNEDPTAKRSGWILLIHPDFLWGTSLAKSIKNYDFFDYQANEALFLSEKEENTLNKIIESIESEYQSNMDSFSQEIIISHIETLLKYAERFYHRQFLTRKISNHQILDKLEVLLDDYFKQTDLIDKGLPSVQYVANALNLSPNYLSNLLKVLTGQSTQQHIHNKLINKAKERLSTTNLTVGEIAYELGFEHTQSFSKLFKAKTNQTPLAFRQSFQS